MHTPPAEIEVGDRLSQDEIEDIFNKGFGYRISGINPRRDENDNRFILVFANEDGPYSDAVKQGEFEYIGEGLSGDQSEESPGNSALIDAIQGDFPVYFFYKEQDRAGWDYQGEIDVLRYRREEQDGREVLIFSMQHQESSDAQSPGVYLIPVSDYWRDKFRNSVEEPHDLQQYAKVPSQLEGIDRLRIWATTETDANQKQSAIDEMKPGDYILFYYEGEFFAGGTVGRTFENPTVGELIWEQPESRHIYTIDDFTYEVPGIERVWDLLGYDGRQVVQGFTRVADGRVEDIRREQGSLESVFFGDEEGDLSEEDIEREKSELEREIQSEPELTEDETRYVETRRRARDRAFTELVRGAYENTCAVCGSQRESPNGNPEVEAAHIYPLSEGGRNDVRNGVALCKLHHWCFDSGWFSFTDDHTIIVAEIPERNGYHEFMRLDGESLTLPDNEDTHPHPMFLEQHRGLNGFEQ
jgi:putative restriction endonuclease